MFAKLGQRSISWWICVTITGVFAASLLTVVAYPVYAICASVCVNKDCGGKGPPNFCSTCNTGLNGGEFRHEAALNTFAMWLDAGTSSCFARLSTYHSVEVDNQSSNDRTLTIRHKSLMKLGDNFDPGNCPAHSENIPNGTWERDITVDAGDSLNHRRTQTVTYRLADPSWLCEYGGQAVTQVWYGGDAFNADVHCAGPKNTVVCSDDLEYTEIW